MPLSDERKTKRPRLALSCVECRRRKLKCDKAEPRCNNCLRSGEACVYNPGARDATTGRVVRAEDDQFVAEQNSGIQISQASSSSRIDEPLPGTHAAHEISLPAVYLNDQRGHHRYVDQTFWGLLNGEEELSKEIIYGKEDHPHDMPPSHVAIVPLALCIQAIPTRPVSDAFVKSFYICIHPLHPLMDTFSFKLEYELLWDWFGAANGLLPVRLVTDPTFMCLLLAILYTGACTMSEEDWKSATFHNFERIETIKRLSNACHESLDACKYTEHPTIYTLIASILLRQFTDDKAMGNAIFISTTLRLVQSMGLHREIESSQISRDVQRKIWWHVLWLDVQASLTTGLPPCCGKEHVDNVEMIALDKTIGIYSDGRLINYNKVEDGPKLSLAMLYARGRYETAKLQHQIFCYIQGAKKLSQQTVTELTEAATQLRLRIDVLITKIPTQGIPEEGIMPSVLTNASPRTDSSLYEDQVQKPGILGAWIRIMLSLLKLEVVITLQKTLLVPFSEDASSRRTWNKYFTAFCSP